MLKKLGVMLMTVWMLGALVSGIYANYELKKQCIHDEGFFKGWLWCSQESAYSFGWEMIKGFQWPVKLVSTWHSGEKPILKRKDLDGSKIYSLYICLVSAEKLEKESDYKSLRIIIETMRYKNEKVDQFHEQYMGYAVMELKPLKSNADIERIYSYFCSEMMEKINPSE